MSDITLITPPDHIYNDTYSFLLIYPSSNIKEEFNKVIGSVENYFNVYLYDGSDVNPDWLLATAKQVDCIILDIDNSPVEINNMIGYFIANPKTYWLTKGEHMYYNKISNKRIYNLDFIKNGGNFETQQ